MKRRTLRLTDQEINLLIESLSDHQYLTLKNNAEDIAQSVSDPYPTIERINLAHELSLKLEKGKR